MRINDGASWRNDYLVNVGQNLSEMDVRTFARIKKVIWDQLLATKAEIIQI